MHRQRPGKLSPVRPRLPVGHAASIADLALEVCEEKLAETRRRKRPVVVVNADKETENPFLSRLGSPFVVTRSIQGNGKTVHANHVHPLKAPRIRPREHSILPQRNSVSIEHQSSVAKLYGKFSIMDAPTYTLFIVFLILIVLPKGIMRLQDRLFHWHALSERKLNGRHCVLNLFIHKHKPDEFNPDLKIKDPFLVDTYRTKGQIKVISRLISCVADSFRNKLNVVQHVVFAGTRDGGHLAQEASLHWPPRGTFRTNLHVFADGDSFDSLAYQNIAEMESRFTGFNENIHLYDSKGNIAGIVVSDPEDDDSMSDFQRRIPQTNLVNGTLGDILWDDDEYEANSIIPYFHVDGTKMGSQLDILKKAESLFHEVAIAVVGIEHSPDMNIRELVEFFTAHNYKTFMLGLRELSRIDNVCPEMLENLLDHPSLSHRNFWPFGERQPITPPFFVAMPKGRHQLEEMTIQHMYDLFSGEGGGGQVKTANDRKAPGKK